MMLFIAYGEKKRCIEDFGGETTETTCKDLGIDGRIILIWILKKYNGLIWLRIGTCGAVL